MEPSGAQAYPPPKYRPLIFKLLTVSGMPKCSFIFKFLNRSHSKETHGKVGTLDGPSLSFRSREDDDRAGV